MTRRLHTLKYTVTTHTHTHAHKLFDVKTRAGTAARLVLSSGAKASAAGVAAAEGRQAKGRKKKGATQRRAMGMTMGVSETRDRDAYT